jgi:thioredoxin-related protein
MQKVKYFFGSLLALSMLMAMTNKPKEKVNWINFEQLELLYAKAPRPIIVDLYTDWCGWCKVMDKNTYGNSKVAAFINEHYYAVKYNAESKENVLFNGKTYSYNPEYKTNAVAIFLSRGQLEYPNTIFLSSINASPAPLAGYMKPKEFEAPVKYFSKADNQQLTFEAFNQQLKKEW